MPDRLAVPCDEDVSLVDAGRSAWSLWIDAHDHHACFLSAFNCDRLEPEAEIASRDPSVGFKLCRDSLNGSSRDDKHASAWPENRHANCASSRAKGKTSLGAASERDVEFNAGVDLTAPHTPPSPARARDDAERCCRPAILGAEHECE